MDDIEKFICKGDIYTKTYITKEEFIKIIKNLRFVSVKTCELHLITGFEIDENEAKPLGYDVNIY